ncbi:sigma-70 family RNA polymerase sigma factor [Devosia sp.]|uniref:sigma-70 family RNA polymerase sigma factor n=1 Tax=Devosia sp. TaxID=1871048 RepID=UPI003A8EBE66
MSMTADMESRLQPMMIAALAGDAVAYRRLLDELRRHLTRYYARRLSSELSTQAEDLVQETLMAIHTRRMTYDTTQRFTVWVHAIARYKLIDLLRRRRVRQDVPLEDDAALFARDEAFDATAKMDVDTVLSSIADKPADLIRHVKLEGASIAEAAKRSGMSESAVKVSIHRGLKSLTARFASGARDE